MILRTLLLGVLLAAAREPRDVSDLLKPIREKHKLPGLAGLVLRGDGTVVAQGVDGVRKRGEKEAITLNDRFHLGSCTKSMTATLIATLVDEGKLSWTTTVGDVFADVPMHADWKPVTLELLLRNRSGAPGDLDRDGLWAKLWSMTDQKPSKQRRALVEGVLKNPPVATPGTKFVYSNAGFAIAGAMAEKMTGQEWEELLRARLFRPLEMTSAMFGPPGTPGKLDEPLGHRPGGAPKDLDFAADNPAAIGPAGTACMSLGDWAKYVALHVRFGPGGSRQGTPGLEKFLKTVKVDTLAHLHEVPRGVDPKYAMGWLVLDRDWAGGPALSHNGSNTFWFVVAWLAPSKDFAVLVGINQGGNAAEKAADEAAWALIQDHLKSDK